MAEQLNDYKMLVEAALFVTSKAMSADELAQAVGIASVGSVSKIVEELVNEYNSRNSAVTIFKVGEKYVMGVKEPYAGKVAGLAGSPDLTKGALRILAYISKNEPIMQRDVVKTFGSASYDYIKELVENDFIATKKIGRTKRIDTTQKFKEYFNLS
ncbi:MAG: SMC-Scp complex subunit ScpB [Candidatus Marsarchaeota archaeon]|nr:SMC-Scp complex subunit ScpB [Candidatus Marsarchaeota archaeon]